MNLKFKLHKPVLNQVCRLHLALCFMSSFMITQKTTDNSSNKNNTMKMFLNLFFVYVFFPRSVLVRNDQLRAMPFNQVEHLQASFGVPVD